MNSLKRVMDLSVSAIALILFMPIVAVISVAVKIEDGGPILYKQERAGIRANPFKLYKFRTMVIGAEKKGAGVFVLKDDPRITRVGKILRHTSLDELPQLINIFNGEMSLVGPRPALLYQLNNYNEHQKKRLEVKPGITGWAQVNGRSSLTWPERIEQDLWYISNRSLWLDLKIMILTCKVIFKRENLYKPPVYDPIAGEMNIIDDKDNEKE